MSTYTACPFPLTRKVGLVTWHFMTPPLPPANELHLENAMFSHGNFISDAIDGMALAAPSLLLLESYYYQPNPIA